MENETQEEKALRILEELIEEQDKIIAEANNTKTDYIIKQFMLKEKLK